MTEIVNEIVDEILDTVCFHDTMLLREEVNEQARKDEEEERDQSASSATESMQQLVGSLQEHAAAVHGNNDNDDDELVCAICIESLDRTDTNYITTPCNHKFHATCFLQNVAYNGTNCPICRHKLIDEPREDSSDDETEDDDDDDDDTEYETFHESYSLQGMTWMFMRHDSDPEVRASLSLPLTEDESFVEEHGGVIDEDDSFIDGSGDIPAEYPDPTTIVDYLRERNVTYDDLVTSLLLTNWIEQYEDHAPYRNVESRVYGMMLRCVNNNVNNYIEEHEQLHEEDIANRDPY